ncbi:hypothetical protein C8F04DRAFT_1197458 [Mycena alexandri]|uniref:Uncharacterized protein n=1 Tax=Mycena alexandri TaxID=1745969 RepID=A0AAD6S3M3_9AGAR|nr:hypothetical protein C8F04DRAFT_1197458 [Mycena alexandri]
MAKGRRSSGRKQDKESESSTAGTEARKQRDRERSKIYYAKKFSFPPGSRREVKAAAKAKRRVSDGPRRAKLAASKLAAAEVAASEVLTKMLELKQAEPSQHDEEEEELSEWEPPGPEVFALWRANRAKDKAELQRSGEWSESEEECGAGSRQQTPAESGSCSEIDVAQETGNWPSFNPTADTKFQQSQSRAKRTVAQFL